MLKTLYVLPSISRHLRLFIGVDPCMIDAEDMACVSSISRYLRLFIGVDLCMIDAEDMACAPFISRYLRLFIGVELCMIGVGCQDANNCMFFCLYHY